MQQKGDLTPTLEALSATAEKEVRAFVSSGRYDNIIHTALRIRAVETTLYNLFGKAKLHGTIHTCVGQELIGAVIGSHLEDGDFVTSNHRGHGHFIGATGNWQGLIDEVVGNADGVCAGIGGSQHLYSPNFISNGQQGGLLPVAAGVALDRKARASKGVAISFIGEGTLGEGVLYEVMNLSKLWELPHLIVCENNFYSQSTPQHQSVAGEIAGRASAFGWAAYEASTWNPRELDDVAERALDTVRNGEGPAFLQIKSYRLSPHSKGDDFRDPREVSMMGERDFLNIVARNCERHANRYEVFLQETYSYAEEALTKRKAVYRTAESLSQVCSTWHPVPYHPKEKESFVSHDLCKFYSGFMDANAQAYFLGEDIADPYGGAFKVSRGLSSTYPTRAMTTPISEAAITGVGIGLAIMGNRPIVEIMFGDFITLAFDQIVNNASKFYHMYDLRLPCPVIIRTPMGGHRGYGPTHSQSLERFLVGIDDCIVVSVNSVIDIGQQLAGIASVNKPMLILENKVDYARMIFRAPAGFLLQQNEAAFPSVILRPEFDRATITLVSYGGMARVIADEMYRIFYETEWVPELLVLSAIHPLDIGAVINSVRATKRLAIVEEGAAFGSVGAEIVAQVSEKAGCFVQVKRIAGEPLPIPSSPELESLALPSISKICAELRSFG